MVCFSGAHQFIIGHLPFAARISGNDLLDTNQLLKNRFGTPKASTGKYRLLLPF
jgi:hypothetical protein